MLKGSGGGGSCVGRQDRLRWTWRTWGTNGKPTPACLREYGQKAAAKVAELHAMQLREALRAASDESLTLAEAAAESGYSKRRLRELVPEGSVPNAGRKGAPRIRRGDLPRKAKAASDGFDAGAEARAIMGAGR